MRCHVVLGAFPRCFRCGSATDPIKDQQLTDHPCTPLVVCLVEETPVVLASRCGNHLSILENTGAGAQRLGSSSGHSESEARGAAPDFLPSFGNKHLGVRDLPSFSVAYVSRRTLHHMMNSSRKVLQFSRHTSRASLSSLNAIKRECRRSTISIMRCASSREIEPGRPARR